MLAPFPPVVPLILPNANDVGPLPPSRALDLTLSKRCWLPPPVVPLAIPEAKDVGPVHEAEVGSSVEHVEVDAPIRSEDVAKDFSNR